VQSDFFDGARRQVVESFLRFLENGNQFFPVDRMAGENVF